MGIKKIDFNQMEKFIHRELTAGTKNKNGIEYVKVVFANLAKILSSNAERIKYFVKTTKFIEKVPDSIKLKFTKGDWIDNSEVLKQLSQEITEKMSSQADLNQALNSSLIKEIFSVLKEGALTSEQKTNLDSLEKILSKKITVEDSKANVTPKPLTQTKGETEEKKVTKNQNGEKTEENKATANNPKKESKAEKKQAVVTHPQSDTKESDITKTLKEKAREFVKTQAKSFSKSEQSEKSNSEQLTDYIHKVLNDPLFTSDPKAFMKKWKQERGTSEEFRFAEDSAHHFFKEHLKKLDHIEEIKSFEKSKLKKVEKPESEKTSKVEKLESKKTTSEDTRLEVQLALNDLVEQLKDFGLTKSLGKKMGLLYLESWSLENLKLEGWMSQDLSKMSKEEAFQVATEAFGIAKKGFLQIIQEEAKDPKKQPTPEFLSKAETLTEKMDEVERLIKTLKKP